MKTSDYKQQALKVHRELVRVGMYNEARRLLRALNTGRTYLSISLFSDIDWSLADFYGVPGAYVIRIR